MNKKNILKEYKKKINEYKRFNEAYYDKNNPIINDSEFDEIKQNLIELEKKYKFLNDKDSPSNTVGYKPSKNFNKIPHKAPMLSLANAFSEEDLENFEKKIKNYLNKKDDFKIEYSAEPKIDGISASLIFKNGNFIKGLSRGDGKEGEDITENLRTIKDIPHSITNDSFPREIDIRGEVFIQNDDFKKINDKFANPRNAASGSLRQKDPKETKKIPLKFIAYTYGYERGMNIDNQNDFLRYLHIWGFKTNPYNKIIHGTKNLMRNYKEIEKKEMK